MQQRSICIETLDDLVAHRYGLNAYCDRCHQRVDLDMDALIRRFSAGSLT